MLDFIAIPIGQFLLFIYNTVAFHRYGLAIIILTIIIRLLLLPLTVKQYSSTLKMQEIQPKIQEIQKRYKNDKEKLNEELMKFYQENNVNPAGGCLPLVIQMPIIIALYNVIQRPLRYMVGKSDAVITEIMKHIPGNAPERIVGTGNSSDISIINYFTNHMDKLPDVSNLLSKSDVLNMNFFGLNLGLLPKWNPKEIMSSPMPGQYAVLLLIPIFAVLTTYLSIKFSTLQTAKNNKDQNKNQSQQEAMQNSMQNSMKITMPLVTAIFVFSVPAGLGLYWIVGNIFQIFQQLFMNKYFINKKKEAK